MHVCLRVYAHVYFFLCKCSFVFVCDRPAFDIYYMLGFLFLFREYFFKTVLGYLPIFSYKSIQPEQYLVYSSHFIRNILQSFVKN